MLGQLLHSFNPSRRGTPRQSSNLIESVTEDSHTRNLLFPDASALYQNDPQHAFSQLSSSSSPAGSASYDGTQAGIDLDQHRDFRIIIAQDEAGATPRTVLFDSKPGSGNADSPSATSERRASRIFGPGGPAPSAQAPGSSNTFTPGHGRRSSLAPQGSVPQSPTVSAFQRARTRGASISNMQTFEESAQNVRSRDDVDDRVDVIGQHWDVIVRTLTSLQFIVQDKVMNLFKAAEQVAPPPQPPSRTHGSRNSHREPYMPPRRMLKLQSLALLFDPDIKQAVDSAADRVSTDDGVGIGSYRRPHNHSASKLEQMVQELQVDDYDQEDSEDYEAAANNEQNSASPGAPHSAARAIPVRSKHLDSPLKLSVNENDGVIDVDIALPGFGSPIQSPLLPALGNSVGSLEGSTFGPSFCSSAVSLESQPPVNVAGWLARYHPDFAVQGVQPYADLEKDVRNSMSAEPTPIAAVTTPTLENGPMEKWVHICTALIADARTFTIKRLHLKRKVRLIPIPSQPAITPGQGLTAQTPGPHSLPKSQYGNPYTNGSSLLPAVPMTELHLDEKFEEETVMDLDETLADALEKGIASSGVSTPALTASTSSINPAISTPTQRTSTIQDKSHTPQTKSRLHEQDEDVSPKKQVPATSSVNTSTTASATASASSSRSSSRRSRGNNAPRPSNNNNNHESSDAASTITSLEGMPRGNQECKLLVLGALEQVVRSVAAERTGNFMPARAGKGEGASSAPSKQGNKQRGRQSTVAESLHKESTLREGVRRWLAQVEDGN
ncbi:hypothetical protein SLS57_007827 [Botryosphaeria dothidea]